MITALSLYKRLKPINSRDCKMKITLKRTLTLGIISLISLSFQTQAMSNGSSLSKVNLTEQNTLTRLFNKIAHVYPLQKISVESNRTSIQKPLNTVFYSPRVKLHRTAGPSGMFRRVVNAPGAGGRLSPVNRLKPSSNKGTMRLSANVPSGMGLQSKDFEWTIRSKDRKVNKHIRGKNIRPLLPAGEYKVRLTIGSSTINKTIQLSSKGKNSSFSIKPGSLKASVLFSGGSAVKANWTIYKLNGKRREKKVYGPKLAKSVSRALPPGKYEIVSTVGRVVKKKVVSISSGKTKKTTIRLSGSKVKLLATKSDNKSPLMKKTTWIIKNASTNKVVLTKNRHSASIMLPPGKYIASATSEGITKKKNFVVKLGKSSKVHLALK